MDTSGVDTPFYRAEASLSDGQMYIRAMGRGSKIVQEPLQKMEWTLTFSMSLVNMLEGYPLDGRQELRRKITLRKLKEQRSLMERMFLHQRELQEMCSTWDYLGEDIGKAIIEEARRKEPHTSEDAIMMPGAAHPADVASSSR